MQYTSDDALAVAENKILMLYILEKVKKDIAYKVYLELVTTLTEINYFVFHETLEELIEEGYILKEEKIRYIDGDKTFDEVLKEGQEIEWDKGLTDKEDNILSKTEEEEREKSNMTIDLYEEMVSERKEEESKREKQEQ